jgi:hypothetical protein
VNTYNTAFPVSGLDAENLSSGYAVELKGLIEIAHSGNFSNYLSLFSADPEASSCYLESSKKQQLKKFIKHNPVISANNCPGVFREILYLAHLAVCTELLENISVPVSYLQHSYLPVLLDRLLSGYIKAGPESTGFRMLSAKLHSADAFRTMQILKFMGLFSRKPACTQQLSLGAGSGEKDLRSIHLKPVIRLDANNMLKFTVEPIACEHTVLVDGDPQRGELFKQINKSKGQSVQAYNCTTDMALPQLAESISQGRMEKRNTVVGLRIDHRMIPDVEGFFASILDVIDDSADLIITIGSGFDMDDFRGRTQVLQDMHGYLTRHKLMPLLIKLHGDGDLEAQRTSHAFGLNVITTYQVLHCRLLRNKLLKKY